MYQIVTSFHYFYEKLSPSQASSVSATATHHTCEIPLQATVGHIMHESTRNKFIIKFPHSIGASIDYARVLCLEIKIAIEVVKSTDAGGGAYELFHPHW